MTRRRASVMARVAIQEALSAEMSTLHVDDSLTGHVEPSDHCRTMIVTPDGDDDDNGVDDSSDDDDYTPAPVVVRAIPKSMPKKVRNKKSDQKLTLDRNFICYLRPHTFDHELFRRGKEDIYSIEEMERFDADFRMQLHFNFSATRTTQKQRQAADATRASRLRDIDLDSLPESASTTTISNKRQDLSRYVLEDILDCPVGSRFIVCIVAEETNDERSNYYLETARVLQIELKRHKLLVETWRMSGKRYLIIQGRIDRSSHYNDIKMKSLSQRQFGDSFWNGSGDIAIQFDGIGTRLTIPWRDFINASRSVMLFGFPFEQPRSFAKLFRKMKVQHAHHIFRQFASEYFGDSRACSMLFIEYQQAKLDAMTEIITSPSSASHLFNESSFKSEEAQRFQYWFDRYCEHAFLNCMNNYNDYSQPLIVPSDFMNYLNLSKHVFPQQWEFLSTTRGITLRDRDDLQEYKERQIFMVLLNLQRLSNFRALKHWAMVISTAYYGWGAKDTVCHIASFLGITVSRTTRDAFFKKITIDRVESFRLLLSSRRSGLMVWDNFQRGQQLREQRGGHSSKFLIGTVEAAHRVEPFLNKFGFPNQKWNDRNMFMSYNCDQSRPSPLGMRSYELIKANCATFGTDIFVNGAQIDVSSEPCFTGNRVRAYENIINIRKYICDMSRAFSRQFDCNEPGVNADHIRIFNEYCSSVDSNKFFASVTKFQRKAVLDWNATADSVTMSFNMGFVGIREDSAAGAGSVVLDMLLKFGLIKYNDDNTWGLADDVHTRRLYSFGDRKSNENASAFVTTLSHRPLTFEESSMQAEVFLESFQNVMFLPGDWHTGMNMLQSIYKVFWTDILCPLKSFLGWKRISMDVRGCYFQAARLVRYIHNVMSTYLLRCFVSLRFNGISESMKESANANVLCNIAVGYREWLMESLKASDHHLRLCAHFILMSGDFLEFVNAYRSQDSVTIESGYSWFAPRWKLLGQCKYLEAYHEQLDCLLRNNQYSRLEEVRRNRCVRTYHGSTGKMAVAHDEWLELNNKEFAMYPVVRSLDGMMRQGQFIGLTQKAKRVVETIYSPGAISDRIVHRSGTGSKGNCSPEKELIGEVIGLFLGDPFDENNSSRALEPGFMMSLHELITTNLNRTKLQRETTFIQHEDSAGILLNGVNHIYGRISVSREQERQGRKDNVPEGIDNVIDEVMEYEPEIMVPDIDEHVFAADDDVDDDGRDVDEQEMTMEVGGVEMRPCLTNLVEVGWQKLKEMNIKKTRMAADDRTRRKRLTTRYIMDRVKTMKEDLMLASIPVEMEIVTQSEWVSYMRELRVDYYD